jgi:hypothetical protein
MLFLRNVGNPLAINPSVLLLVAATDAKSLRRALAVSSARITIETKEGRRAIMGFLMSRFVSLWENTRAMRDTARDRVTRTLTEEGCREYLHLERCRRTEARVFEPKGGKSIPSWALVGSNPRSRPCRGSSPLPKLDALNTARQGSAASRAAAAA